MYPYATAYHSTIDGRYVVNYWSYAEAVELAVEFMAIELLYGVQGVS